jgi:hypothetical protein
LELGDSLISQGHPLWLDFSSKPYGHLDNEGYIRLVSDH